MQAAIVAYVPATSKSFEAYPASRPAVSQVTIEQSQRLVKVSEPLSNFELVMTFALVALPTAILVCFIAFMNLTYGKDTRPRPITTPGMPEEDVPPLDFPLNIANTSRLTDWMEKG